MSKNNGNFACRIFITSLLPYKMALEGYTSFVIEGEKGKELYDLIMTTKASLSIDNEIEIGVFGSDSYRLGLFRLDHFKDDQPDEFYCAWYLDGQYAWISYIDEIEYKDNALYICTSWRRGPALLEYLEQCGLNDYEGYYYHDSSEHNIYGTTNDQEGKYFVVETPPRRVLYVHGYNGDPYGSSYQFIKDACGDNYDLFTIDYDPTKPLEAINTIKKYVYENQINYIIGASLGGFLTLQIPFIPRIVVNPCWDPAVELPLVGYTGPTEEYKQILRDFEVNFDERDKDWCAGCFAEADELLSTCYKEVFLKSYVHAYSISGGHKINAQSAVEVLDVIGLFEGLTPCEKDIEALVK